MWYVFIKTNIPDVLIIEPDYFPDDRGFFMETYNSKTFLEWWIANIFIQDNHSKSHKGVFRWFHFQSQYAQAKLVRVVSGSVLDFAIDLRRSSSTFGQYVMEELSAENKRQLFIPQWFAHGFLSLQDNTEFLYKCDNIYAPLYDSWILYNDISLSIDWSIIMEKYKIDQIKTSEKDRQLQTLEEYKKNPIFL